MNKIIRVSLYFLFTVLLVIAGLLTYIRIALPNVGEAPALTIENTPERIARGEYLANHVTVCMDCHSKRDWTKFSGPLTPGTLGMGGERFDETVGMPGAFFSKNITPEGISRYSDGELFRLITTGVNKEGKAYFPLMPFTYYGRMDPDDIYSVMAYVRSLAPIKNNVPDHQPNVPMSFVLNTLPQKADPQKRPDTTDVLAYGAYMINATACRECHTQAERGQIIQELAFSGGREFQLPDGSIVRSSNITPDPETGIGKYTEEAFIQRFKIYADTAYRPIEVAPGEFNSIMPWTMYAGMQRRDLAAIYAYLKSLQPVVNKVEKFTPPSK